jgi:hypothetical protein
VHAIVLKRLIHLHARKASLEHLFIRHVALENRILAVKPSTQSMDSTL